MRAFTCNRHHTQCAWLLLTAFLCLYPHRWNVDAAPKTRLTWVNGVGYNLGHMDMGSKEISDFFGGENVDWCHNPTMMASEDDMRGYISDLTQAGTQKMGRITSEVNTLVEHLRAALRAVGKKGRVVHIAHSQGALITSLAAKQLTPLEMNQMEVIAFGGAAALRRTAATPFQRCVNYYSINDPLLWLVPAAEQALRSGYVVDEEFCFLAPRVGDPIADHDLTGPTYAQALQWEGQRFQRKYHNLAYRSTKQVLFLLLAIYSRVVKIMRIAILFVAILCRRVFERMLRAAGMEGDMDRSVAGVGPTIKRMANATSVAISQALQEPNKVEAVATSVQGYLERPRP
mmetsp:Transcript_4398/g.11550  ORF Transcript_4398/g.11550 Transcript_4398/m.11550 type:complete len:344 (-) Transcript_4398:149-1180(-)|eukprot:CAMPEP_0198116902 /NCGR_PEP_ID=MMETSP1442-20131203/15350_1 /TAXON_ID= /ORGANISM="Craspedostauros australis, Strain CCMP3328" /LENGTH=343 /DNA_ID=CAMNT_0043774833 /DNA_START=38 /DNA_END=1069 /DNA_ORIENTATION=+